jgi:hypothetical protein
MFLHVDWPVLLIALTVVAGFEMSALSSLREARDSRDRTGLVLSLLTAIQLGGIGLIAGLSLFVDLGERFYPLFFVLAAVPTLIRMVVTARRR